MFQTRLRHGTNLHLSTARLTANAHPHTVMSRQSTFPSPDHASCSPSWPSVHRQCRHSPSILYTVGTPSRTDAFQTQSQPPLCQTIILRRAGMAKGHGRVSTYRTSPQRIRAPGTCCRTGGGDTCNMDVDKPHRPAHSTAMNLDILLAIPCCNHACFDDATFLNVILNGSCGNSVTDLIGPCNKKLSRSR